jgi:hypothetical protein
MFPTGSAGIALIVLRSVIAITVVVDVNRRWTWGLAPIVEGTVTTLALCLFLGILTPYCATLSCLIEMALLTITRGTNGFELGMSASTAAVVAVLGPGAYSLDARIFGRKLITIPPGRSS